MMKSNWVENGIDRPCHGIIALFHSILPLSNPTDPSPLSPTQPTPPYAKQKSDPAARYGPFYPHNRYTLTSHSICVYHVSQWMEAAKDPPPNCYPMEKRFSRMQDSVRSLIYSPFNNCKLPPMNVFVCDGTSCAVNQKANDYIRDNLIKAPKDMTYITNNLIGIVTDPISPSAMGFPAIRRHTRRKHQ